MVRVDPDDGAVDLTVGGLGGASAITFADGIAWVAGSGAAFPLDAETGELGVPVGGGAGADGGIAAADGTVWVRNAAAFLRKIDAASGEAVAEIQAEVGSSGDVLVAFDSVWATAYDDGVVFRLRAD